MILPREAKRIMAKRRRTKKNQQANTAKGSATKKTANALGSTQKKASPAEVIERLSASAASGATEADIQAIDDAPQPPQDVSPDDLISKCTEAEALFKAQAKRAHKEADEYETKTKTLEKVKAELEIVEAESKRTVQDYETKSADIHAKEKEVLEREECVQKREIDADAEFAARSRLALENLEKEAIELRDELTNHRSRIAKERADWERERQEKIESLNTEIVGGRS
jgi:hypothetical protein